MDSSRRRVRPIHGRCSLLLAAGAVTTRQVGNPACRRIAIAACAVALGVAAPSAARTATPSTTPTELATCVPTPGITSYCATHCEPCPTIRAGCNAQACRDCIENPVCSPEEICVPVSAAFGNPGCCTCATATASLQMSTPTPTPSSTCTPGGLNPPPGCLPEGALTTTPTPTCVASPIPRCSPGELVCRDPHCHTGCSCATRTTTPRPMIGACVGDCNGDGTVRINELILGVNIALGNAAVGTCASFDCPQPLPGVFINCAVEAVNNALLGCRTTPVSPTVTATPTRTRKPATPTPLVCEGCNAGDVCSEVISGVTYTGSCGDGQIIDGKCFRSCDWEIPPDVCGGDACNSGSSCLTIWHGLVVGGSCHLCTCIFNPGTPTSTGTPTLTGQVPTSPTPTVPPALERAISFICGGREYERTFAADGTRFSGSCHGFEHFYGASMQQFSVPADASQALDEVRERGTAVPFRGSEAISWSELQSPERYDYYVWAHGCWYVWVLAAKNLGSPRSVGPLGLAEAIYAFASEDGLFEMCQQMPTPSPHPTTGCEEACDGRFCVTEGGVTGNCLLTDDSGKCRCVLEVTPTTSPSMGTATPTRPPGPTATLASAACRQSNDCNAAFELCLEPGGFAGCGICYPETEIDREYQRCSTDAECGNDICEPLGLPTRTCSACFGPVFVCMPGCSKDDECAAGKQCDRGRCVPQACSADQQCPVHHACLPATDNGSGVCLRKTCTNDAECSGGFCVKGMCYDALGRCTAIPA